MLLRHLVDCCDELLCRLYETCPAGHRIDKNSRKAPGIHRDLLLQLRGAVKLEEHDVIYDACWHAWIGGAGRIPRCVLARLRPVICAVVRTLHPSDCDPAGRCSSGFDGKHDGFRSTRDEADLLNSRNPAY
ncbi:hypothetical protein D3C87_1566390 [compost metagenome]